MSDILRTRSELRLRRPMTSILNLMAHDARSRGGLDAFFFVPYRYRRITQVLRSCSRCVYRRRVNFAWPVGGAGHRVSIAIYHASLRFSSLLFSRHGARRGGKKGRLSRRLAEWSLVRFSSVLFGERCVIDRSSRGCLARMQISRRRFPG